MLKAVILFAIGLVLLIKGGDWFVDGATGIARRFKIPEIIVDRLKREEVGIGFNAATGEWVNMIEAGIVDPTKVTRSALQNAASVSSTVLTTEALVVNQPEPEAPAGAGMGGGMGGMY